MKTDMTQKHTAPESEKKFVILNSWHTTATEAPELAILGRALDLYSLSRSQCAKAGLTRRNPVDDTFADHDHRGMGPT